MIMTKLTNPLSDETFAAGKAAQNELVAACKNYVRAREVADAIEGGTTREALEAKIRLYRAVSNAQDTDQKAVREARR